MRASSAITIMSEQSAMSEPPATAKPCTLQITGRLERNRLMNWLVLSDMAA
jgi:hypothetical protein